jgi:hypothetical protein
MQELAMFKPKAVICNFCATIQRQNWLQKKDEHDPIDKTLTCDSQRTTSYHILHVEMPNVRGN